MILGRLSYTGFSTTLTDTTIAVDLRTAGLGSVVHDMLVRRPVEAVA